MRDGYMSIISTASAANYRRDLGDGLVLRWSTAADIENIAQLTSMVFRDKEEEPPNQFIKRFIPELMSGKHPLMGPGDYGVVEDTRKDGNPLVACTCLWRHVWEYEGIPFHVGRPEIVGSDSNYRNRGLIRALFEMVHARSEEEGHLVQAITGIPYFYRQFGYEYALDLEAKRTTYLSLIPKLKEGETEPYTLRDATVEDIPLIQEFYQQQRSHSMVWNTATDYFWRYEIEKREAKRENEPAWNIKMIVDAEGNSKGYLMALNRRWGRSFNVHLLDIATDVNQQAVMPSVLRGLQTLGEEIVPHKPDIEAFSQITFYLGRSHPIYDVLGNALAPSQELPYAWYVRVRDLPAFIKLIAPALEKRLASSVVASYTGELKLDFYRGGLRMAFENGHLTTAEHWRAPIYESDAGANFPPLVFLQLLFGYRSVDDLRYAFPDVRVSSNAEALLKALFPARPSFVLGI
jgi:hypothetical protein